MWNSPFIVPVAAFAMVLGIVIAQQLNQAHRRRLQSEERLAAISRGLPLPPEPLPEPVSTEAAQRRRARGLRTAAIVLTSTSVGTALFAFLLVWILQEREILSLAALSVVPLAIGIGLFVDYRFQTREIEQFSSGSTAGNNP